MASSLTEDLKCSICLDLFEEPRMLRCGHNFCLTCLRSCVPRRQNKGKCPECRILFTRKEFISNRTLANLADKARQLQLEQEPMSGSFLMGMCKEHNEPLKLFCKRDLVPICVFCRNLPQHRRHLFLPIQMAIKYAKGTLKPYQSQLGHCLKEATKVKKEHQKKMAKMLTCAEKLLRNISSECDVFRQLLQEKEEDIKKNVEEMIANCLEEMQDALRSLQKEISSYSMMKTQIKNAQAIADNLLFLKGFKPLVDRVKEFQPWNIKNKGKGGWRCGNLLRRGRGGWRRGGLLRRGGWRRGCLLRRGVGGWRWGNLLRWGGSGGKQRSI